MNTGTRKKVSWEPFLTKWRSPDPNVPMAETLSPLSEPSAAARDVAPLSPFLGPLPIPPVSLSTAHASAAGRDAPQHICEWATGLRALRASGVPPDVTKADLNMQEDGTGELRPPSSHEAC